MDEAADSTLPKLARVGLHNGGLFLWKPGIVCVRETKKKKSKYLLLLPTPHPLKTLTSYQAPTKEVSRDLRCPRGWEEGRGRLGWREVPH